MEIKLCSADQAFNTTARFLALFPADQLQTWAAALGLERSDQLALGLPKGYLTYEPLAIFPSTSLSDGPGTLLGLLSAAQRDELWRIVLEELARKSGMKLTHLAVNAGIPPLKTAGGGDERDRADGVDEEDGQHEPKKDKEQQEQNDSAEDENILRSPTGLRELYGSFGSADGGARCDFDEALWVWTRQNGIWQTWAPKWTMFSRGNVVEKARLLDFHSLTTNTSDALSARQIPAPALKQAVAVDMYAGIGYFVFSYARLGMRVFGWELNPWSVEGLRRGAERNGWSVQVVRGENADVEEIGNAQIVVFQEDNRRALQRLQKMHVDGPVLHVNGGLLPSSEASWRDSWEATRHSDRAWLHLHDNVGVDDIDRRADEIEDVFNKWAAEEGGGRRAKAEYTMKVKTYAPGVWHCVYDVYVYKV